jgi:hypothetical protein
MQQGYIHKRNFARSVSSLLWPSDKNKKLTRENNGHVFASFIPNVCKKTQKCNRHLAKNAPPQKKPTFFGYSYMGGIIYLQYFSRDSFTFAEALPNNTSVIYQ